MEELSLIHIIYGALAAILYGGVGFLMNWANKLSSSHSDLKTEVAVLKDKLANNSKADDDRANNTRNFEDKIWSAIEGLRSAINELNLKVERLSEKLGK